MHDLRRSVDVAAGHLGDVHQALDGVAQLDEGAEGHDLGDLAVDDGAHRVVLHQLDPRVGRGLLETEGDALTLQIDVEHLDLHLVAHLDDLGGMVDMVPGQLGDVHQAVDAAQVHEGAEVHDGGNVALEAHALGELGEDLGALVLAALLQENAAGQHDVVAVAIHLDDAGLDLGAQVGVQILHAAQVHERRRKETAQADVQDKTALDHLDDLAGDHFAGLELLLDGNPGTLVLGALLGEDEAAVLVLLLENQRLDLVAQAHDVGRIGVLADGQLAGRDDALALEADVHQHLVVLQLDDGAVDEIALVELGQRTVDHLVHLLIGDVGEVDHGGVLDFGQNGPLSKTKSGTLRHDG